MNHLRIPLHFVIRLAWFRIFSPSVASRELPLLCKFTSPRTHYAKIGYKIIVVIDNEEPLPVRQETLC